MLSQSEGQILIDITNDHGLKQLIHFPMQEENTLELIITFLPSQFQDIPSCCRHPKNFHPPQEKNLGRRFTCVIMMTTMQ